ncbi:unnamed protein product [Spirodela intermedia]|uniref:Peroxidase n=1 Tax=Spirodela intermedia TaxID=51605 RepID=A0A7I8JUA0_SPIIN|nr:unnamed protein product [Spirodela intermedia]CAA6673032.1 unnamed protein product [Spirodela intermedia]
MTGTRSVPLASLLVLLLYVFTSHAQLTANFYSSSCPNLETIVQSATQTAVGNNPRTPASLLRLFFHDCFVQGCDGSVLLNDTPTFTGEQGARANRKLQALDVIEKIKSTVEVSCNGVVSCADILALATRDGVVLSGGPSWTVPLGRRDATTASLNEANINLPGPSSSLSSLITRFASKGLSLQELVALSGAHTVGFAPCRAFRNRIYNDVNIDPIFANSTKANCPVSPPNGDENLSPLDVSTPTAFDNAYYTNLLSFRGLLHSDQELFSNGSADSIVQSYAASSSDFFTDFAAAMVKLGSIDPLTGSNGEIRQICSTVN